MRKKAVIEISLIEESTRKANNEIEEEIFTELSQNTHAIPWAEKIENVKVQKTN
ncbi:MAG: hypothetical protein QW840_01785 [Candidatus Bathyarchaeia archaeon]